MVGEADARKASLGRWLARHPSEKDALVSQGLLDILSTAWADCWHDAAWDTTRRTTQLGLYLSEVCARLQEVAMRLDEAQVQADSDDLQKAIRADIDADLYRLDELEHEAEVGSPNWVTTKRERDGHLDDLEELPF